MKYEWLFLHLLQRAWYRLWVFLFFLCNSPASLQAGCTVQHSCEQRCGTVAGYLTSTCQTWPCWVLIGCVISWLKAIFSLWRKTFGWILACIPQCSRIDSPSPILSDLSLQIDITHFVSVSKAYRLEDVDDDDDDEYSQRTTTFYKASDCLLIKPKFYTVTRKCSDTFRWRCEP